MKNKWNWEYICFLFKLGNSSSSTLDEDDTDYGTAGYGKLCPDSGFETLADIKTCKSAAKYYGKDFGETESVGNYPKGCYVNSNDHVYFNFHPTGRKSSSANSICQGKSK